MFVSNDLAADRTTDLNLLAYTDTETSTKYYVGLNSDEVPHYAGKVLPYELTYLINNENSVARKFYIDDMMVETGPLIGLFMLVILMIKFMFIMVMKRLVV